MFAGEFFRGEPVAVWTATAFKPPAEPVTLWTPNGERIRPTRGRVDWTDHPTDHPNELHPGSEPALPAGCASGALLDPPEPAAGTVTEQTAAVLDLAAWRACVVREPVGPGLAGLLDDRPRRVDPQRPDPSEPATAVALPVPLWANALLDSLTARQRLIAHLQARQVADLADLSGRYPGIHEFLPTEIALALGMAESTAATHLRDATDLVHRLPGTFAALDAGRITQVKAATIRAHTDALDLDISAAVEADVLSAAPSQTVPQLRAAVQRAVIRRDPDGAEDRHETARSQRRVTLHTKPEGMAGLWFYSTAQDVATVHTCLTALGAAAKTPDDDRTSDARCVDALVDVCADILDRGHWQHLTLPTRHRRRPHLDVTVPFTALIPNSTKHDDAPRYPVTGDVADLAGYGPITPGQARVIAADATLRRLVCDPTTGILLDYGRTTYTPPAALADHVLARDRTCVLPGCGQPAYHADLDHIESFRPGHPTGGRTSAANLAVLCRHHHRAKDGGEFRLTRHPDGTYTWTTPLGRTYTRPPTARWQRPPPTAGTGPADDDTPTRTPRFTPPHDAAPPF